jgi:uncharacterized membrane protein YfcA
MKMCAFVTGVLLAAMTCHAEPGEIKKQALMASVSADMAVRDGTWLKWACEVHRSWSRELGTLWQGTDSKQENLAAGLCAGFITGVMGAPGVPAVVSAHPFAPDQVLAFLETHPMRLGEPAGVLVVEALSLPP